MLKKEDVLHIADLARLSLNDDECVLYQKDLNEIIGFASKISDLSGIAEKVTPLEFDALREDLVKQEFNQEELLSNAPESENGYFSVAKVIKDV